MSLTKRKQKILHGGQRHAQEAADAKSMNKFKENKRDCTNSHRGCHPIFIKFYGFNASQCCFPEAFRGTQGEKITLWM